MPTGAHADSLFRRNCFRAFMLMAASPKHEPINRLNQICRCKFHFAIAQTTLALQTVSRRSRPGDFR